MDDDDSDTELGILRETCKGMHLEAGGSVGVTTGERDEEHRSDQVGR